MEYSQTLINNGGRCRVKQIATAGTFLTIGQEYETESVHLILDAISAEKEFGDHARLG